MMNKECNRLFHDLTQFSDDFERMFDFVEAVKHWEREWNKGDIKIALIDLYGLDSKFGPGELYIAYNDCCGNFDTLIMRTTEFIEMIQEIYNDEEYELNPEEYWIDALKCIIHQE